MTRMRFLNTYIDNITMDEAVDRIDDMVQNGVNQYVVTPNVDHIVKLEKDRLFQEIYQNADLVLADGQPLIWISRWLGTPDPLCIWANLLMFSAEYSGYSSI